jgi:hypothetical protein
LIVQDPWFRLAGFLRDPLPRQYRGVGLDLGEEVATYNARHVSRNVRVEQEAQSQQCLIIVLMFDQVLLQRLGGLYAHLFALIFSLDL